MSSIPAPDLSRAPEPDEFARVLRLGLGRVVLWLRRHDAAPYRDVILDAVLHDWTYDKSSESTRERYLLDVIDQCADFGIYREQILDAISTASPDGTREQGDRSGRQVVRVGRLLAERGDEEIGQALRNAFDADPLRFPAPAEIVKLYGLEGLVFVASRLGRILLHQVADLEYDHLHLDDAVDQIAADGVGMARLLEVATTDPFVAAYVGAIRHYRAGIDDGGRRRREREEVERLRYDEFSLVLPRRTRGYPINRAFLRSRWGQVATEEDLLRAANDLLALPAEDPWLICCYLNVFEARSFPLDPTLLFAFVRRSDLLAPRPRPDDEHPRIEAWRTYLALSALQQIAHPAVRSLGLEVLESSKWASTGAELLVRNFQLEDLMRIEDAFHREADPDERHGFGFAIMDIGDRHRPVGIVRSLGLVYEHGVCAFCRRAVVSDLNELEALPDWMAEECRFDSNEDVRQIVAAEGAMGETNTA